MWYQWFNLNVMKLWEYFFVCKENKNHDFIHYREPWQRMCVVLLTQEPAFGHRNWMHCGWFTSRGRCMYLLWYSRERASKSATEEKSLNKVIICVFFACKKNSSCFIILWLNHSCHMDYFNNADFIKNILICVPKMNKGHTGLERHEGEWVMTQFSFLVELSP